jgi:hypothetical protein
MIRVEREHRFDCSVEAGFAYITDLANWPAYWPGFVRLLPGSRWQEPGDEAAMVVRLLGRDVELRMTLRRREANRFVEYTSRQAGLPDARHERHFAEDQGGMRYRLVVEYAPRPGLRSISDRFLVRRGVERAMRETITSLEARLGPPPGRQASNPTAGRRG